MSDGCGSPGVFAAVRHLGTGLFPAGKLANRRLRLVLSWENVFGIMMKAI